MGSNVSEKRADRWASSRVFKVATWTLIALFALLAVAHLVLTILSWVFDIGQGYGFFLSFEWPAWLITIADASVAWMLWKGYQIGRSQPGLGFALMLGTTPIVVGRTVWMVFPLVLLGIALIGAGARVVASRRATDTPPALSGHSRTLADGAVR